MNEQNRSVTLLWNDASGWDAKGEQRKSVESTLTTSHLDLTVKRVEHGRNLRALSKSIVEAGTDVLVAAGGDGTINAAASALIHQPTTLGVIPAGTLNHFARDLHIPIDPAEAARVLLTSGIIQVDAGEVIRFQAVDGDGAEAAGLIRIECDVHGVARFRDCGIGIVRQRDVVEGAGG